MGIAGKSIRNETGGRFNEKVSNKMLRENKNIDDGFFLFSASTNTNVAMQANESRQKDDICFPFSLYFYFFHLVTSEQRTLSFGKFAIKLNKMFAFLYPFPRKF